jgi:hypothetical protein
MENVQLQTHVHVTLVILKIQRTVTTVYQSALIVVLMAHAYPLINVCAMKDSSRTLKMAENVYQFAQQDVLTEYA